MLPYEGRFLLLPPLRLMALHGHADDALLMPDDAVCRFDVAACHTLPIFSADAG